MRCGKRLLVSLCHSVRLSAFFNSATAGRIFLKFYPGDYEKSVSKFQMWLISDKIIGQFSLRFMLVLYC